MADDNTVTMAPASPANDLAEAQKRGRASGEKVKEAGESATASIDTAARAADARVGNIENLESSLMPPPPQTIPPPKVEQTDPVKEWGSMAMIVAGLGSLLTRTPATTALNAAAGVINGFKKNDQQAADQAFKQWQVASKNLEQQHNYQMEVYKAVMDRLNRSAGEVDKQFNRDTAANRTEFAIVARAQNDPILAETAEVRGLDAAQNLLDKRDKAYQQMTAAAPKLIESKNFMDGYAEMVKTPEWQSANAVGKVRLLYQLMDKKAPSMDTRGDGGEKDLQSAKLVYSLDYPADPTTGARPANTPTFDQWYQHSWPTWGRHTTEEPGSGALGYGGTNNPAAYGALKPAPLQNQPDPLGLFK